MVSRLRGIENREDSFPQTVPLILPVDNNLQGGWVTIFCRAGKSRRKKGVVPARHSDDQVSVGAKRYKQSVRVLAVIVNIRYLTITCVRVYIMPLARGHWFLFLGLDMWTRENK